MLSRRLLRVKVVKMLYAHLQSDASSLIASEKNLAASIDKTYDLYHQVLMLIADVAKYAGDRIELGKNKKLPTREDLNPNMRFVENRVVVQISESKSLRSYAEKKHLGWAQYPEVIKNLYNGLIDSDFYKTYMSAPSSTYKQDQALVVKFFTECVNDNAAVEDAVEEQSILWNDDLDFALIMVMRTLEACRAEQEELPLLPAFKDDEDRDFPAELFRKALVNYNDYLGYIEHYTQNWDVERIAMVDNIIMVLAMTELLAFPSIPVKVTLDEFIEISKFYSTPGSSFFINGVLDKIAESLRKEGRIEKSGRGLL